MESTSALQTYFHGVGKGMLEELDEGAILY